MKERTTPEERTATAEQTAAGEWVDRTPLPAVQSDAGGGVIDGALYYFGGFTTGVELDATTRAFAYDPSDGEGGSWSRIEAFPRALWAPCGVSTGEKLFSFGGAPSNAPYSSDTPPSDAVCRYVPGEGWTDLTDEEGVRCPYRNWAMSGVYNPDDGLIYCLGGGTDVTDRESASDHGNDGDVPGTFDESRLWTFDPEAEEVSDPDRSRMPEAKRWTSLALVTVAGRPCLHAIAGRLGGSGPTNTNYRYDVERDEWREMTPAPLTGNYGTTGNPVIGNSVYLTHGISLAGGLSMDVYQPISHRYDPERDRFETDLAEPSHPRTGPVDAVIDGTLYVAGGHVKRYDEDNTHECLEHVESFTSTG